MDPRDKETIAQGLSLQETRTRGIQLRKEADRLELEQNRLNDEENRLAAETTALARQMGISLSDIPERFADRDEYILLPTEQKWRPLEDPTIVGYDEYLQKNGVDPNGNMLTQYFTSNEIYTLMRTRKEINEEFCKRTGIVNKTDLAFLTIATALQVAKALLFPYIAENFGYGSSFNPDDRLVHNDSSIKEAQKAANNIFRDKHSASHDTGAWINLLYQTPPYDITVGSPSIGYNMEGKYHRLHTLGHDPILGWLFGTANILTDIVTLDNFSSYRVIRSPKMKIIPKSVSMATMLYESYCAVKADPLNLPAALFTQYRHLKSDEFTKLGLPVPVLEVFSQDLAGKLYKENYDALCLARDAKFITGSAIVSVLINLIITLIHGLFYTSNGNLAREQYEVRTRKILLISNTIASGSSVIATCITKNFKNLDIGGLAITIARLFSDIRFMAKVKKEFLESEYSKKIDKKLQSFGFGE